MKHQLRLTTLDARRVAAELSVRSARYGAIPNVLESPTARARLGSVLTWLPSDAEVLSVSLVSGTGAAAHLDGVVDCERLVVVLSGEIGLVCGTARRAPRRHESVGGGHATVIPAGWPVVVSDAQPGTVILLVSWRPCNLKLDSSPQRSPDSEPHPVC